MLCATLTIHAQTIENLDKKNGYHDFKIGDNYEKWKFQLLPENSAPANTKNYSFIGTIPDLFNKYPIHKVYLKFNNSKLIEINIILDKWEGEKSSLSMKDNLQNTIENFTDIGKRFNTLFGEATKTISPKSKSSEGDIVWETAAIWVAKKIHLTLLYNFMQFANVGGISIKIVDNVFLVKSYTEGF